MQKTRDELIAELVAAVDQVHANAERMVARVGAFAEHLRDAIRTIPRLNTEQVERPR